MYIHTLAIVCDTCCLLSRLKSGITDYTTSCNCTTENRANVTCALSDKRICLHVSVMQTNQSRNTNDCELIVVKIQGQVKGMHKYSNLELHYKIKVIIVDCGRQMYIN